MARGKRKTAPGEGKKPRGKRKLTPQQKREKRRLRELYETVFINGKQKRVRRVPELIEGIPVDEFIRRNADPIWLLQEGYELLPVEGIDGPSYQDLAVRDEIPF